MDLSTKPYSSCSYSNQGPGLQSFFKFKVILILRCKFCKVVFYTSNRNIYEKFSKWPLVDVLDRLSRKLDRKMIIYASYHDAKLPPLKLR